MADHSAIEWTEATWNPTVGCTKVSPGCDRCYAERIALRFPKTFPSGFELTLRPDALDLPLHWRRPRTIFVNSMSDLFHVDVPDDFIANVFDVMARTPQHTYQVLTKRAQRLGTLAPRLRWPPNVWMGVSVESPKYEWRIEYLRQTPARIRFISAEPLLSALPRLPLNGIHWLIAGGESQPGARPARAEWFEDLRDQCSRAGVAFFLKQLGGHPSKRGGEQATLDGRRWTDLPSQFESDSTNTTRTKGGSLLSARTGDPSNSSPVSRSAHRPGPAIRSTYPRRGHLFFIPPLKIDM
jgi:protein gp37